MHCDLHDDYTLKAVNFLASSVVSLSQRENSAGVKKKHYLLIGTFRLEYNYDYDYDYKFSVLSTRIRFPGRHFSKCAC